MGLDQEDDVLSRSMTSRDNLSRSFPSRKMHEEHTDMCISTNRVKLDMGQSEKKQNPSAEIHSSLQQEIFQLENRLHEQFKVRSALEVALGFRSPSFAQFSPTSMPKPATDLIKEIAVLELEVVYLEQYLLSLYRKAFDQHPASASPSKKDKTVESCVDTSQGCFLDASTPRPNALSNRGHGMVQSAHPPLKEPSKDGTATEQNRFGLQINSCYSALPQSSGFGVKSSPMSDGSPRVCQSEMLSVPECAEKNSVSNVISLAEHLGTCISDHVPETPNRLSEDMIRCMSAIYCKLAESSLMRDGLSSPVSSSMSSPSGFSQREPLDMWSPGFCNSTSFDVRLDNPFHVNGIGEFSGPYSTLVEVSWLCRDSQKLAEIEHLLQDFRSLISRLEEVNPGTLNHEEKLAFWINIHNALVMHAFLAYGIPKNNTKRLFMLLKAAYNIGGHMVSAGTIQTSILRCRMLRPNQWIRLILSSKTKFKAGDDRQVYAVDHPEPLLHFALSCGTQSDPAIRVYSSKRVLQELEMAKIEYIRATCGFRKDKKILLPKVVETFAKETGLCPMGVVEMVQKVLPESSGKILKNCQQGRGRWWKNIEWAPHNFSFRYLIPKELAK